MHTFRELNNCLLKLSKQKTISEDSNVIWIISKTTRIELKQYFFLSVVEFFHVRALNKTDVKWYFEEEPCLPFFDFPNKQQKKQTPSRGNQKKPTK